MPGLHLLRLAVVALCVTIGLGSSIGIAPSQAQQLEKRIALVIGNGAYQASPLTTPANDAGLIAQTLQAAGFDVVGARDLDTATLRSSLREFLDKASASGPDTVALVYFAANGLQFEGENYLVPVDARIARDADVPLEAVRLSDLTKPLAALPLKARIVVLDAAYANGFARSGQPLAGGLTLVQPDPGTLLAFNAAPGTIGPENKGPYGAYATALSEMIKEGGLPLDDLFERVRLRVDALTHGAELPWHASRVQAPFLFFERTQAAPQAQAVRFSELRSRPIRDFDAGDAYLAALARDTMRGYLDFLAAYPSDPLAKRVRAIIAARREAATWRESAFADTPDAYWSYLRRYPRGPHAYDARRRLAHFAAVLEPPAAFAMLAYDVAPPPPEEVVYVERPVVYFADPVYDLPPPPPVPVFFLPPRPAYFVDLPPPPPPAGAFVLPIPVYHPVPTWIERPAYVAPPPLNVVNVNIHNTVVINQANQTAIVTNPAGQQVAPIPANLLPPQPAAPTPQGNGPSSFIQAHPVASAAIAAAAVALPAAAALHGAGQRTRPANAPGQPPVAAPQAAAPNPAAPINNALSGARPQLPAQAAPTQAAPAPAANLQPQAQPLRGARPQPQRPGQAPTLPVVPGAQPLPAPNAPPAVGRNTLPQAPGVAQIPPVPAHGAQPAPNAAVPAQANPQAVPPAAPGARPLPTPSAPATAGRTAPPLAPGMAQTPTAPAHGTQPAANAAVPARANPQAVPPVASGARPLPTPNAPATAGRTAPPQTPGVAQTPTAPAHGTQPATAVRPSPVSPPQAVTNDAAVQRQQQAAQQRAQQAAQQQAAQAAAQQRAQQTSQEQRQQQAAQAAAQQRAQQAAQQQQRQQQAAQAAAQQRAQQAAQQRQQQAAHAQQQAAQQQAAQQRARQAAQQAARPHPAAQQQKRPNCGHPGEPVCH
ncbi:caspase family protein [Bosea psychrotolerans]|uniref:Putative caspase-like protein n=1 Tax=Bosea psychrotolerans TaxID=1871628 RepID=A0A2S4MEU8_9HYPH|nr:caspase domain-containing protein [Bosea psychrotolerans]POR53262.1 putative caspase-like protein [Bosea psychrotolerans]